MTTCCCDRSEKNHSFPYLAFLPVIASLSAVLLLILRSRRREISIEQQEPQTEPRKAIRLPSTPMEADLSKPDDLTLIEGIGPKVSATLIAAGIRRFSQIAALKPEVLKDILVKAGNRLSDPTTWPDQARLAAEGKWKELEKLQAKLKGGRKV